MRRLILLRPKPGLSQSAERARALGLQVVECPLFRIEPMTWSAPDAEEFDALLLTSANAVQYGGAELSKLMQLPVKAVGEATAEAAREAGFYVDEIGNSDVATLLAPVPERMRLLHLAGLDHIAIDDRRIDRRIVYRSAEIEEPGPLPIEGAVVAVHSARAGARLKQLAEVKNSTAVVAISSAAASACGPGWLQIEVAAAPNDKCLLALAAMLCHTSAPK